ncbi:MAG: hypothetical protein MI747_05975 [Desulfobacterales bacterium]|nr:hypothetical protein [Desulfobacterales bacterium]
MKQLKLLVEGDGPTLTLDGRVKWYKSISRSSVLFELEGRGGKKQIVELTVSTPWVIRPGDRVVVKGEACPETGKFVGYAYLNETRRIMGQYEIPGVGVAMFAGGAFIFASLVFAWAIFPLFIHLPMGLKSIKLARAAKSLNNRVAVAAQTLPPIEWEGA